MSSVTVPIFRRSSIGAQTTMQKLAAANFESRLWHKDGPMTNEQYERSLTSFSLPNLTFTNYMYTVSAFAGTPLQSPDFNEYLIDTVGTVFSASSPFCMTCNSTSYTPSNSSTALLSPY